MKLILVNAIGDLNLVIEEEIKDLNNIEMKIMMRERKVRFERISW